MLADPLPLKRLALSAHAAITVVETVSWPRLDSGDGSARYETVVPLGGMTDSPSNSKLKISHSVSNEQKPAVTDRTLIRIDSPVVGLDGKVFNAYAYIVIGMPRVPLADPADLAAGSISSAQIAIELVEHLIAAVAVSSTASTLDETKITRILAGES
jgi:hypothetical protein